MQGVLACEDSSALLLVVVGNGMEGWKHVVDSMLNPQQIMEPVIPAIHREPLTLNGCFHFLVLSLMPY